MSPQERTKLVRVLGMLGSDFDGERAAAAIKATRLLNNAGLTWDDVVVPMQPRPAIADRRTKRPPLDRRQAELLCDRHYGELTDWERMFLDGIGNRPALSPRQSHTLGKIADALRARGFV